MNFNEAIQSALENHKAGNLRQAELIYRNIIKARPNDVDALHLLGVLCHQLGDYDNAIEYITRALKVDTGFAEAYNNLGNVLRDKELLDEAETYYQKALQIDPHLSVACNNLGNIYSERKQPENAVNLFQKALKIKPDFAEAHSNLGKVLTDLRQFDEALVHCRKAIQINPDYAQGYYNLGTILNEKGQMSDAIFCYQTALKLDPLFAEAYQNLGIAFRDRGQVDVAETCFRQALKIKPDYSLAYDSLLFNMACDHRYGPQRIFSEHLQFAKQIAEPLLPSIIPHRDDRPLSRRLRICYVSPDFRRHSVKYFLEPVLASHNLNRFEIFCYSDVLVPDNVTKRLREYANQWRSIVGMSDENVAELVRKDKIDILIDLAGHTGYNRMLLFARKPAPVQLSWLGYPNTTGLSTIDYRIVDGYTDPEGLTDPFYTERLLRLPDCFLCYLPDQESPDVGSLPALSSGHITFGSFNSIFKISAEVIELWARILISITDSHLILKAKGLGDSGARQRILDIFQRKGISAERIELLSWVPSAREHLELYNGIDLSLDTFPYNGTTTTCEAMWMGVPVVTLAGNTHISRVGVSLLSNVGFSELVAQTTAEYMSIAVDLAKDLKRLQSLRKHLRDMMRCSPLCDAKRFTVNLEMCYRQL